MNINFIKNKKILILYLIIFQFSIILAQTTCNNGVGRVLYERLPNQQLQGFDDDVVRDTAPPFRVLEKCQDLCLRDRTASNNLVRACTSFDFQPGSRIASFSGTPEYEESTCYLTREQAAPEGIGNLMLVPNSVHFTEVCLASSRPERECPSRRYVFERHPRKKLKLPISDIKEITAANRTDCEDKCLNEFSFVCRSANFDSTMRTCTLSRFTRRTHPELLEDDPNSDYLENTCLNAERRCDGLAVFVKEENKRLGGPFEVDIFNNMTLEECQTMCLRAEKYFCRSVEFDDQTKQCILSEEDSISQKDDISISSSPTHHFYDLVCLDNQRGTDYPDNSVTSHLFSSGRRPDTAFQRYRNSRLGGEFHSEITGRSLSECLDECLRQTSFQCRSAVYSDRFRTCRLSRYNQKDGMRIIYDADYDYYENLMLNVVGNEAPPANRPDTGNRFPDNRYPADRFPTDNRYPDRVPDNRVPDRPPDRYSPDYYQGDRYPPDDRYPSDEVGRYPPTDNRIPYDRYPIAPPDYDPPDRYVPGKDRYPSIGDRYPPIGDRYPPIEDRYPPGSDRYPSGNDRYPPGNDRYPLGNDRYPPGNDRYPPGNDRYRPGADRFSPNNNRYPPSSDRYPPNSDRYPPPNDRYPPKEDRYPSRERPYYPDDDKYGGRYPPVDDNRIDGGGYRYPPPTDRRPPYGRPYPPDTRRPIGSGERPPFSEDKLPYPPDDRAPFPAGSRPPYQLNDRYPYDYMDYYGREYGKGGPVPDRRIRPSSLYPGSHFPPINSRLPPPPYSSDRFRPDLIHNARRPEPDGPISPPTSPNKFPIGTDRYPSINIYKYGNDRFRGRPGYERAPPYYDQEYDDRNFVGRPDYESYDREYGGFGYRRPQPSPGLAGYPPYEPARPYRPSPPGGYNGISGYGAGGRPPPPSQSQDPQIVRCEEVDNFKQIAARHKMRRQYVKRVLIVPSLVQCQRECIEARDFICRSFNYRDTAASNYDERDAPNCELSDRDSRELDVHNPTMFDSGNYDFYERSSGRTDGGDCLDVSQTCNEEGMEFTLRTPEGYHGRIYTYGFYDRCFFRGNGGTANVLRISGPQGYPDCGTQRYGDTLTNIIVVQFSDNVQTSRDKRYNLTCVFRGPGEAVVTSGYIGAGLSDPDRSGSPIPIEYLPAENTLSSKVRLMILYQNRPTTTIAVGDPLTFRLEAQDGYNQVTDIFATNVVARDPYSGRSIQLIDRYGCPVDPYVFPELDKLRDGDTLEARFNAFKIPESNFLVFEATVRSCRDGCQPAYCPGPSGRSEPSFGRRRRSINETIINHNTLINSTSNENITIPIDSNLNTTEIISKDTTENEISVGESEKVREMIEVYDSRDEIEQETNARKLIAPAESVCITPTEYHGLITSLVLLILLLFSITIAGGFGYQRYWRIVSKNHQSDRTSPITSFTASSMRTHERFSEVGGGRNEDRMHHMRGNMSLFGGGLQKTFATGNLARMCQIPAINTIRSGNTNHFDDSEPIYTDPSLFERSRSLRSLSEENSNN